MAFTTGKRSNTETKSSQSMKVCNSTEPCSCTEFNQSFCKWFSVPKKKKSTGLKKTKLKPVSEKQKKELQIYSDLRRIFLQKNPLCQVKEHGCTNISTDVHHSRKRGKFLNKVETWVSCCRNCHDYIEMNKLEAREKGWLI